MSDSRLDPLLVRLRAEFPNNVVAIRPYQSPDDPSIEYSIDILGVSDDDLIDVSRRAWELAFDLFGTGPVFFMMTSVDKENSAKFYAKELAEFGRAR